LLPPGLDRGDGELGGVGGDADADPALVAADLVDAVRDRLAQLLVDEVVRVDEDRLAGRRELSSCIFGLLAVSCG